MARRNAALYRLREGLKPEGPKPASLRGSVNESLVRRRRARYNNAIWIEELNGFCWQVTHRITDEISQIVAAVCQSWL